MDSVKTDTDNVAQQIVRCLESEGVEHVFGVPGEENIHLLDALIDSKIHFTTVRHEQGASFIADSYGCLTGKAGVCLATLGPGAINLALGVANAQLDSHPLVALVAQAGLDRSFKESHQVVDLESFFEPIAKWVGTISQPETAAEVVRKAFKLSQTERPGATVVILPEDVAQEPAVGTPLVVNSPHDSGPSGEQIARAVRIIEDSSSPIVIAGPGAARDDASAALIAFSEKLNIPVVTTFAGKGVFPDNHENCLGTIGFMAHDYANFGFDGADTVIAVGYDLIEYAPSRWNPARDKRIIHIHRTIAEVDAHYELAVGIQGSIAGTLDSLGAATQKLFAGRPRVTRARELHRAEIERGKTYDSIPLKPQRIVADIRAAMGESDIVLADTGAQKMWMARLYPCYLPNTCLLSNGLATMAFSLPGAIGAKLAHPERKVLASMGDGGFLMNSQEIETAVREKIPFVILVWVDEKYGLIEWKQKLETGRSAFISFTNPDLMKQAESYGIDGVRITAADELLPALEKALAADRITLIECPVDYSENVKLTDKLGALTTAL